MNVKILPLVEINQIAAEMFKEVITSNEAPVLGLATGSTPVGVYENLVKMHKAGELSFANVQSYNLDEYYGMEPTHEQSYRHFMEEHLFNLVDIDKEKTHVPSGLGTPDEVVAEYEALLADNKVDLQILGIGTNGHIAFNEPGTPFDTRTHVVQLDEKTRLDNQRFFNSLEEVPTQAVSMGLANIMETKKIVLIALGENKAKAVKGMVEGEITTTLPASILQNHPDVTILVDEKAGSLLSK
ncbi:MAG: glucosamine-6-phosphate deaminase [Mycoplasmatales bacterium]